MKAKKAYREDTRLEACALGPCEISCNVPPLAKAHVHLAGAAYAARELNLEASHRPFPDPGGVRLRNAVRPPDPRRMGGVPRVLSGGREKSNYNQLPWQRHNTPKPPYSSHIFSRTYTLTAIAINPKDNAITHRYNIDKSSVYLIMSAGLNALCINMMDAMSDIPVTINAIHIIAI